MAASHIERLSSSNEERTRSGVDLTVATFSELAVVVSGVEMASRFRNQFVIVDLPKFVAADLHFFFCSARASVRSGKRPMEFCSVLACFPAYRTSPSCRENPARIRAQPRRSGQATHHSR